MTAAQVAAIKDTQLARALELVKDEQVAASEERGSAAACSAAPHAA